MVESPDENEPAPRRTRKLRTAFLFAVALVAAALGLVEALQSPLLADLVRRVAEREGSKLLGEDLAIRRIAVDDLAPLRVTVEGVTVHARDPERRGLPLLRLDELTLGIDTQHDPRDRRLPIQDLHLAGLAVRVALDEGQPRDFRDLIARLRTADRTQPAPLRIELGNVTVTGVDTRLSADPAGIGTAVHGFELAYRQDREGMGAGSVQARSIEVVAGPLRELLSLAPAHFRIAHGLVELEEQQWALRTGELRLRGEVRLPPAPGTDLPGPSYRLEAETSIDLALLREAWAKIPPIGGVLHTRATAQGSNLRPQVDFELGGEDIWIRTGKTFQKEMKAGDFTIRGYWFEDVVRFTRSSFFWAGGEVGVAGQLLLDADRHFRLDVDFRQVRLEELLYNVTVTRSFVSMRADGTAWVQGRLRNFEAEGETEIDVRELIVENGPWHARTPKARLLRAPRAHVQGPIRIEPTHLLLGPARVRGPGSDFTATADFIFQKPVALHIVVPRGTLDLADIDGRVADLRLAGVAEIEGLRVVGPANRLEIRGRVDATDLEVARWPLGSVSGDVSWQARSDLRFRNLRGRRGETDYQGDVDLLFPNLRFGGSRARAELDLAVEVPEGRGRAEDVLPIFFGDTIDVRGSAWGTTHLRGPPKELSGTGRVAGKDLRWVGERFAGIEVDARVDRGTLAIREAFLRKARGQPIFARGTLAPSPDGAIIDLEVRAPALPLAVIDAVPPEWTGLASGALTFRGALRRPEIAGTGKLEALAYRGTAMGDLSADLQAAGGVARVQGRGLDGGLRAEAELGLEGLRPYSFRVEVARLRLDPFLPTFVARQREPVSAGLDAVLRGSGTWTDQWHELALELPELWLERGRMRVHNPAGKPVRIAFDDGALRLAPDDPSGAHLVDGLGTDLRFAGWIRPGGPLDLRVDGPIHAAWLELLGDHWERVEARRIELTDVRATGTVDALELSGGLQLEGAIVRTRYFPETAEIEEARASLRGRRLSVESFEGRLGGGRLHGVAGSTIQLGTDRWVPREYDLSARCTGCTVRFPSFLPPARGDAQLTFRGEAPDKLVLGGRIDVDDMVLREPINWQRSVLSFRQRATDNLAKKDRAAPFGLDLYVDSALDGVRITNNLGDIRGRAVDLHVGGDTNHPVLSGQIEVSGGTVRYSGHDFALEPGTALFRSRTSYFPDVVLSMWTDIRSRDDGFRVSYTMTGPLDRMRFSASSSPPLPEKDIHSLLLFGLTEEQLAQADLGDFVKSAASVGLGTYATSVAVATTEDDPAAQAARLLRPDRVEVLPVYTDATGTTSLWAVLSKEVIPGRFDLEGGIGLFGSRSTRVNWVTRARIHFLRNVVLEGSWVRDDLSTQDYGNFALDMKLEFEAE